MDPSAISQYSVSFQASCALALRARVAYCLGKYMRRSNGLLCFGPGVVVAGLALVPSVASAQSSTNYNASNQWGTYSSGIAVTGAVDSALAHYQNGAIAGEVNAARLGTLINSGGSNTIEAIGSQTIVSSSIVGNDVTANINATQTSSNSGDVRNGGQIGHTNSGNTNN